MIQVLDQNRQQKIGVISWRAKEVISILKLEKYPILEIMSLNVAGYLNLLKEIADTSKHGQPLFFQKTIDFEYQNNEKVVQGHAAEL
jgi:hypothetical protein